MSKSTKHILPVIVFSQFAGTSLWFAGNAVVKDMAVQLSFGTDAVSYITSAVQFGFIMGTLLFALFTIVDRFSPSRVFFICAVAGALSNLCVLKAGSIYGVLFSRFITGFFLAGIYPVGMKIAADYYGKGLSKALGYLVGALVLGTSFPHLLNGLKASFNWDYVILFVSSLAVLGGLLILLLVPDGPYRIKGNKPDLSLAGKLFKNSNFRSAAFGYFGHMWELYTFWALVPVILSQYLLHYAPLPINVSILSFVIIGSGSVGCVAGGYISLKKGNARVAFIALLISCICCIASCFAYQLPLILFILFLLVWGITAVADSPQFTTLVAQSVDVVERGTALTIVNCIGFAITIISVQLTGLMQRYAGEYMYCFLAIGPLLGLLAFRKLLVKHKS